MSRCLWWTLFLSALFATVQADESVWVSERGLFNMHYTSELEPLQINTLHSWVLHLTDANGEPLLGARIAAEGGMPQHDHGLPTRPRVTRELGDGRYQLDGLRFHMTGEWEITFRIEAAGKTDSVVVTFTL